MKFSARLSSSTTESFGGAAPGAPICCTDDGDVFKVDGGGASVDSTPLTRFPSRSSSNLLAILRFSSGSLGSKGATDDGVDDLVNKILVVVVNEVVELEPIVTVVAVVLVVGERAVVGVALSMKVVAVGELVVEDVVVLLVLLVNAKVVIVENTSVDFSGKLSLKLLSFVLLPNTCVMMNSFSRNGIGISILIDLSTLFGTSRVPNNVSESFPNNLVRLSEIALLDKISDADSTVGVSRSPVAWLPIDDCMGNFKSVFAMGRVVDAFDIISEVDVSANLRVTFTCLCVVVKNNFLGWLSFSGISVVIIEVCCRFADDWL